MSLLNLGTIRGHVREVQSGVTKEATFHLAEAWVLHLTKEVDLLAKEAALHLVDEALHLGEVGPRKQFISIPSGRGRGDTSSGRGKGRGRGSTSSDIPSGRGRGRGSSGRNISPENV
ncbi:unnamed protein product [Camellia sinensis]